MCKKILYKFFYIILTLCIGIEPTTFWLTAKCSTTELTKHYSPPFDNYIQIYMSIRQILL